MGVVVRQQLVSSTQNVSTNLNSRRTITVHETGNEAPSASAAAHANLQSKPNPRVASWHYQVDAAECVQSFRHAIRTFHAGTALGNRESISIEICVNSRAGFAQACRNAAALVASIMRAEGIPIERVVQHNAYSGKNCPTHLRAGDWGVTWASFLGMVRTALTDTSPPNPGSEEEQIMAVRDDIRADTQKIITAAIKELTGYRAPGRPDPVGVEVGHVKTKLERADIREVHFQREGDPDDVWCVYWPGAGEWAVCPDPDTWKRHNGVLDHLRWSGTLAIRQWGDLVGQPGARVHNPAAFGPQRSWRTATGAVEA